MSVPCAARLLRDSCKATCVRGLVSTKVLRTIVRNTAQAPSQDVVNTCRVPCTGLEVVACPSPGVRKLYHLTRVGQTGPALH